MMKEIYETNNCEELWVADVGSHLWKTHDIKSDFDLAHVYQQSTKKILEGYSVNKRFKSNISYNEAGIKCDNSYLEIGHIVNLLKKGNINALIIVTSPLTNITTKVHRDLFFTIKANISKNFFYSICGLCASNMADLETEQWIQQHTERQLKKKFLTVWKMYAFGIELLSKGELNYGVCHQFPNNINLDVLYDMNVKIHDAYKLSKLPEEIPIKLLDNILFNARMANLMKGEEGFKYKCFR